MKLTQILLATGNQGKLRELQKLLTPLGIDVVTPASRAVAIDVVEDAETFEGNALKKASAYALAAGIACLADDSGLEVDALDGAPGVHSARYGEGSDQDRCHKLLRALQDVPSARRAARFQCALALVDSSGVVLHQTRGVCEGTILEELRGAGGFGYDPVFGPAGHEGSMAELTAAAKNAISHRGKATRALRDWLTGQ